MNKFYSPTLLEKTTPKGFPLVRCGNDPTQ